MKSILVSVAMATLLVAGGAEARPERPNPDANSDGFISREEAKAQAQAQFTRMDVNKDNKLDQADRAEFRETMKAKSEQPRVDGAQARPRREPGRGGPSPMQDGWMRSSEADVNGDGAMSAEEFVAQALRHFDASDVNGDGRIEVEPRDRNG